METIESIRRHNLRALKERFGSVAKLAAKLERSPSQVSQWLNASPDAKTGKPRTLSSQSARYIETKCDLKQGWMDVDHTVYRGGYANAATLKVNDESGYESGYRHERRSGLAPDEQVLLEKYQQLSSKQRTVVLGMIDVIIATGDTE